ncbi:GNAT family N-acetyltransferase [Pseudomonas sp. BN414]|nr:GNAT family N-acetyltransferase [Pseudomonas sp. BN414]
MVRETLRMKQNAQRKYPRTLSINDRSIEIRPLHPDDAPALNTFIQAVPVHDRLFVPRDLGHPKVIRAWLSALDSGVTSLAAFVDGEMIGCSAVVSDALSWSAHVGDLRVLVRPTWQGRGLGRALIQESFKLALGMGLEKLTVQMTVDQSSAIAVFERLGFQPESVLRNHIKDLDGHRHDLALLSLEVAELHQRAYERGMSDALHG